MTIQLRPKISLINELVMTSTGAPSATSFPLCSAKIWSAYRADRWDQNYKRHRRLRVTQLANFPFVQSVDEPIQLYGSLVDH